MKRYNILPYQWEFDSFMNSKKLIGQAIAEATEQHRQGRLQESAALCSTVLQLEPGNSAALHLLGIIAHGIGDNEKALDLISRAIEVDPANPDYFYDCAKACLDLGLKGAALDCLRKTVELKPDHVEAGQRLLALVEPPNAVDTVSSAGAVRKRMQPGEIQDGIHRAISFHQSNQLEKAESIYREVLESQPDNADALHLLGLIHHQRGDNEMAVELMEKAVKIAPNAPGPYSNLGNALQDIGKVDEAIRCYRRAIALDPKSIEPRLNLGTALEKRGKFGEALACYRHVLNLDPNYPKAHNNLGKLLFERGHVDEGLAHIEQAIAFKPDYADAWNNHGLFRKEMKQFGKAIECFGRLLELDPNHVEGLNNMGATLLELKQYEEAIACLDRAISLKPDYADAYNNIGVALNEKGLPDKAIPYLERALSLKPDYPAACLNLGSAYRTQARFDEAIGYYQQALALKPDYTDAFNNLGTIFEMQGRIREAIALYEQALIRTKNMPVIRWNMALSLLASGDLDRGWKEYECRWESSNIQKDCKRPFPQPWWDGSDLAGKTILLWGEQGIGDEILFANVISDMTARAAHCVIECEPRLVGLFSRSFRNAEVIPKLNPPHPRTMQADIQLQSPINSCFRWLRTTIDSFPEHQGYLRPDPERVAFWKERLENLGPGLKVGICWRSMLKDSLRNMHYSQLSQWGPIFAVQGIQFVNLQYDNCRAELDEARRRFGVAIHAFDDINLKDDMDDAAALTSCVDLMVSAGTAAAAMGGATGIPVWLMYPEYSWTMLGTDRFPWFPDTRIFAKKFDEPWDGMIERIASLLKLLSSQVNSRLISM